MKKKLVLTTAAIALLSLGGSAMAAEPFGEIPGEFSANIGFTNDYVFRGITQSDEKWALQGGIDYVHDIGIYVGGWGSNVDFDDGDEATVEIDVYGGWAGEIEGISLDVGAIYYLYPGADSNLDYDYWELAGSVGYDFEIFSAGAGVNFSPDYFAGSGTFWRPFGEVEVPLPYDFTLSGHIAYNSIDDEAAFGVPDYLDYGVSLAYNLYGFDLSVSWVDTDLDEPTECAAACDDLFVFLVSRSF